MKHKKWEYMYEKIDGILLALQIRSEKDKSEPDKLLLHREEAKKHIHCLYNESLAELLGAWEQVKETNP